MLVVPEPAERDEWVRAFAADVTSSTLRHVVGGIAEAGARVKAPSFAELESEPSAHELLSHGSGESDQSAAPTGGVEPAEAAMEA